MPTTQRILFEHVCNGPKCAERNHKNDEKPAPTTITWEATNLQANPFAAPDAFYRGIEASWPGNEKTFWFCSAGCLKDYFTYVYVAPESPREIAERATKEAALEAAKKKEAEEKGGEVVVDDPVVQQPGLLPPGPFINPQAS